MGVLIKDRERDRDTQREAVWGLRQKPEGGPRPRSAKRRQQPPEARKAARSRFLWEPPQGIKPAGPGLQTLVSRAHFCCFEPLCLWSFVPAALGNWCVISRFKFTPIHDSGFRTFLYEFNSWLKCLFESETSSLQLKKNFKHKSVIIPYIQLKMFSL